VLLITPASTASQVTSQICINILSRYRTSYSRHAVSYHVATDKPRPRPRWRQVPSILATIYNQSQLAERKHVARYWSINTATTAVPLSAHPSPLVITTKLAAAILGGGLFGGGFCRPSTAPVGNMHTTMLYW